MHRREQLHHSCLFFVLICQGPRGQDGPLGEQGTEGIKVNVTFLPLPQKTIHGAFRCMKYSTM